MALWALAAPELVSAGGQLLSGLVGDRSRRKQQRRNFEHQRRLMREQAQIEQVRLSNPWRTIDWEGPLEARRQVVRLNPSDQAALNRHRNFRAGVMSTWDPRGGWHDDETADRKLAEMMAEQRMLKGQQPGAEPPMPEMPPGGGGGLAEMLALEMQQRPRRRMR